MTEFIHCIETDLRVPLKEGSVRQVSLSGNIPVEFSGCSCDGEIYEDKKGRLFLVKYKDSDTALLALVGELDGSSRHLVNVAERIG